MKQFMHMLCSGQWMEKKEQLKHIKMEHANGHVKNVVAALVKAISQDCKFYYMKNNFYRFYNRWLGVKQAVAPDIINWENLKIGKHERNARIFFTSLITLILIVGAFVLIILG